MGKKKEKVEPIQEVAVVKPRELVLEGDPEKQLAFAHKAAKALMSVVNNKEKKVIINGKQFLEYGDWQTLARFYGCTVAVEWTKPYEESGKKLGWEARAVVYRNGEIISSAEAMCLAAEPRWGGRDDFQRRSMAQTRAASKALRNALGWVAELAGYSGTPAEEMDGLYDKTPIPAKAKPVVIGADEEIMTPAHQRKTIKDLCDSLSRAPLATKKDYEEFVLDRSGLVLMENNFSSIISMLEREARKQYGEDESPE